MGFRIGIILLLILQHPGLAPSVGTASEPKLTGIVNLGGIVEALLEIPNASSMSKRPILREGASAGGYTVRKIDVAAGSVELAHTNRESVYTLRLPVESATLPTFNFHTARLRHVLDVYQRLSGRTVIFSPELPDSLINWQSASGLTHENAVAGLAGVICGKTLTLKPVAEKFVFVLRPADEALLQGLPEPPTPGKTEELYPPGLIRLVETGIFQVLEVYTELAQRTVVRYAGLRGNVSVRSETALTASETTWLLEAALLLTRVRITREGESLAFALPMTHSVPRLAPLPEPVRNAEELIPLNVFGATPNSLLERYAELVRREAVRDRPLPEGVLFHLRSAKMLSRAEAVFAMRALAEVNGFRFEHVGEKGVRLMPIAPTQ